MAVIVMAVVTTTIITISGSLTPSNDLLRLKSSSQLLNGSPEGMRSLTLDYGGPQACPESKTMVVALKHPQVGIFMLQPGGLPVANAHESRPARPHGDRGWPTIPQGVRLTYTGSRRVGWKLY